MAWVGELMSKRMGNSGSAEFIVDFYDEARKEETKVTHQFSWVPGTTANQAKQDVQARGEEIKGKFSLLDSLKVGAKVPIP